MDIGRRYHKKRLSKRMLVLTNLNQIIEDLLKTGEGMMSQKEIAVKYGLCTKTISRINVKYVLSKGDVEIMMPEVDPREVFKRKELDPLERLKLIDDDCITVIELSFAAMRCMLESEIESQTKNQKGEPCKTGDLKAREITDFIMAVAPYIMPKKDVAKGKTTDKPNTGNNIRQMWLKSQEDKTKLS